MNQKKLSCKKIQELPLALSIIIESYFEYDSPFMQAFSGYSAFEYMMMITVRNQKPMMAKQLRQKQVPEWARSFALDPFNYLETLKAQISAPRRIECLYRRRATMVDMASGRAAMVGMNIQRVVTFGYPIFIIDR